MIMEATQAATSKAAESPPQPWCARDDIQGALGFMSAPLGFGLAPG